MSRESWGNHCEFFLSSLGLAVGLGNVWRFPYVAYDNGGGTFLVPYIIMLLIVGLPCLFVEQSVGQYARVGANKVGTSGFDGKTVDYRLVCVVMLKVLLALK